MRSLKITPSCSRSHETARSLPRGVVILEFILVFPILWIIFLAIFEFGILMLISQAVTSSSIEGARRAAEVGATPQSVAEIVQEFLGVHELTFDTTQSGSGPFFGNARVIVQYGEITINRMDEGALENLTFNFGNTDIPCTPLAGLGDNLVRVTVCVPVTDDAGCKPVPDLLKYFGFSIDGCIYELNSLAGLE